MHYISKKSMLTALDTYIHSVTKLRNLFPKGNYDLKYSHRLKETKIDFIKMQIFPPSISMIQRASMAGFVLWTTVCTILMIPFQIVCLIRWIFTGNIFLTKLTQPNHTDFQFWLVISLQTETLFIEKNTIGKDHLKYSLL